MTTFTATDFDRYCEAITRADEGADPQPGDLEVIAAGDQALSQIWSDHAEQWEQEDQRRRIEQYAADRDLNPGELAQVAVHQFAGDLEAAARHLEDMADWGRAGGMWPGVAA